MTQILPADDPFSYTSSYGQWVCEYLGCRLNSSAYAKGYLTDGWSSLVSSIGFADNVAAVVPIVAEADQDKPRGFINRREWAAEQEVSGTFRFVPANGPLLLENIVGMGVMGRVGGGTLTNDDDLQISYDDVDAYALDVTAGANNLLTDPENITPPSPVWALTDVAVSANTNVDNDPINGNLVVDELVTTDQFGDIDQHLYQEIPVALFPEGQDIVFSCYFQKQDSTCTPAVWIQDRGTFEGSDFRGTAATVLWDFNGIGQHVLAVPGSGTNGGGVHIRTIELLDNDWVRISAAITPVHANGGPIRFIVAPDAAGSVSTPTRSVYVFGAKGEPGSTPSSYNQSTADLTLRRYNSGTATVLATTPFPTNVPSIDAAATMTLDISGTGSTVTLEATFDGFGLTTPLSLTYGDSAVNRITSGGRAGFILGTCRPYPAPNNSIVIEVCQSFQVKESGNVSLRDEWERLNRDQAFVLNWNGNSQLDYLDFLFGFNTTGNSLQQSYAFDLASWEGGIAPGGTPNGLNGAGALLWRDTAAQRVYVEKTATNPFASQVFPILSIRRASDARSQRRSVSIEYVGIPGSTSQVNAGIALRGSQGIPASLVTGTLIGSFSGYAAMASVNSAGVTWTITRLVQPGTVTSLATFFEGFGSPTYWPGAGTPFVLDFEIYTEGTPTTGDVVMKLLVDGVQVPLVASASGTSSDSAGTVRDFGSLAIASGDGEGLYYAHTDPPGTNRVYFDGWSQGALTNAVTAPEEMASVTVSSETDGVTGNLHTILTPEFPFTTRRIAAPFRKAYESGHMAHLARWINTTDNTLLDRKEWTFLKNVASQAEYDAVLQFYRDHKGPEIPFNWTPPGSSTSYVAFFDETESLPGILQWVDTRALRFVVLELK